MPNSNIACTLIVALLFNCPCDKNQIGSCQNYNKPVSCKTDPAPCLYDLSQCNLYVPTAHSPVLLPIPQKSNEYRYLKCIAISILNVEKYLGQYQYPVKY